MRALQEIEKLLPTLTRAEKAQVLQWVARDLREAFPGIESTPGICGGEPCIVRTRIPVWLLVQARRLGTSEADLLRSYPMLRAEDLVQAWVYAFFGEALTPLQANGRRRQPARARITLIGMGKGKDVISHGHVSVMELPTTEFLVGWRISPYRYACPRGTVIHQRCPVAA